MPKATPVALVIGASRGIGRQIAIDLAERGYSAVVAAKSISDAYSPNNGFSPGLNSPQSTISTVEREIKEDGGEATVFTVDVREIAILQELLVVDKTGLPGPPLPKEYMGHMVVCTFTDVPLDAPIATSDVGALARQMRADILDITSNYVILQSLGGAEVAEPKKHRL